MDEKDFEIIKALDKNCRISFSQIAKDVNLSIRTISLRINSLIERNILKKFTLYFNPDYLGVRHYLCSCETFSNFSIKNFLDEIKNIKEIYQIWQFLDNNLLFSLYCKNAYQVEQTINKILDFGLNLLNYSETRTYKPPDIPFSRIDWKIIYALFNNARLPKSEIAKRLNLSEKTIKRRLNRLRNMKLVQFTTELNFEAIKGMVTAIISLETTERLKDIYLKIKKDKEIKYWRHAELVVPSMALFVYGKSVAEIYDIYLKLRSMKEIKQLSLNFVVKNWNNSKVIEDAILVKIGE
ncbi:MAG: Lrp/AsnC family transcriptional regulator [Promethearchaeota archaeon]